jgi:hypothetical protein
MESNMISASSFYPLTQSFQTIFSKFIPVQMLFCSTRKLHFGALFLILSLFLQGNQSFAQASPQTFPVTHPEFLTAFEQFITIAKREDQAEAWKGFEKAVKLGTIRPANLDRIIKTSNKFRDLKLPAHPYFTDYINSLLLARYDADTLMFDTWHNILDQTSDKFERNKTTPVVAFFDFSQDFLGERSLKKGTGGGTTWKIKGGKFTLKYDKEPYVFCEQVRLIGVRKNDSIDIKNTSGNYYPMTQQFHGQYGKVTWERVGLDSSVYVQLSGYKVDCKQQSYKADTVVFYYQKYFPQGGISGKFEDNVVITSNDTTGLYPKFESFNKRLFITNFASNVVYLGGFRMNGANIYGWGTKDELAQLTAYNFERKKVFFGEGQLFIVKGQETILAEGLDGKIYMGIDSIVHPSVNLKIDLVNNVIDLQRGLKQKDKIPFFSSYYNMSLSTDKISWYVLKDSIEIGSRSGTLRGVKQKSNFQSKQFFSANEQGQLQNISDVNPLSILMFLSRENKDTRFVSDDDFARKMNPKWTYVSVQTILGELAEKGFINYYFDRHEIEIREKLFHYTQASVGKVDFDYISIDSESDQTNAFLNLKTGVTRVNNVEKIDISGKQRTAAKVAGSSILLHKNRSMDFDGTLYSGMAAMVAKDFKFDYEKYSVAFDSMMFLDFYRPTGQKDRFENPIAKSINSTIEKVSGVLLVDAPNNKSGREDLPIFPSLQVKKPSYVYYQYPFVQNSAYKRDSFYFELKPFSFNGLDVYAAEAMTFKGQLVSADIFPPFEQPIVVRDTDTSYGFVHKTPTEGYGTYQKKGNFKGEIDLSHKGLWGKGTLDYITATVASENFLFLPREMTCDAKQFNMTEDRTGAVKTPKAFGLDSKILWRPYKDSLYVDTKKEPYQLFAAKGYTHTPRLVLTPEGLKGRGTFEWDGGRMDSKLISYGPFQASSDTADFKIKAFATADVAFDTRNVKAYLDFDTQSGNFKANSDSASTTLPYDKYITSINEFVWDMKGQTIDFKSANNKLGEFVSIDPAQDSLEFKGKSAFYSLRTNELKVSGVDKIKSADAFIYPPGGEVNIEPGGKMSQFKNAEIVADTSNKYHVIKRATIDIAGRTLYKASGYYQYDVPSYPQEIFFENIVGEEKGGGQSGIGSVLTTGSGEVKEEKNFRVDEMMTFKGNIILSANKPNLLFDGFAKLDMPRVAGHEWFTIKNEVDRKKPVLEILNTKNRDSEPLITGFYISKEFGELYPRILTLPQARVDRCIMDCQQFTRFRKRDNTFLFGDSARVQEISNIGRLLTLDNGTGKVVAEGKLNIGSGLQYVKMQSAGRLESLVEKGDSSYYVVNGEIISLLDYIVPKKLLDVMSADIKASIFDAQAVLYGSQAAFYESSLAQLFPDPKEAADMKANLASNLVMLPRREEKSTFVLGRHKVKWNPDYQSFISMEDRVPVIAINGEPINRVLTAFVEYKMPPGEDDRLYIYIRGSGELWYFFGYQAGVLSITSSSTKFNDAIQGMKPKELSIKQKDGETYEIQYVEPNTADRFVNRVKEGRN